MATRIRTVIWSFFFGLQGYETQGIRLSLRFPLLRGLSGIQSLPVLYFSYGLIIWGLTLYYNNRLMTRPYGSSSFLEPVYGFQRLPVTAIIRIPDLRFNTFFTPPTVSSHRHYRGYGYTIYLVSRTTRSYSPTDSSSWFHRFTGTLGSGHLVLFHQLALISDTGTKGLGLSFGLLTMFHRTTGTPRSYPVHKPPVHKPPFLF